MKERENQRGASRKRKESESPELRSQQNIIYQHIDLQHKLDLDRVHQILILDHKLRAISDLELKYEEIDSLISTYSDLLQTEFNLWLESDLDSSSTNNNSMNHFVIDSLARYIYLGDNEGGISPLICKNSIFKQCAEIVGKEIRCPKAIPHFDSVFTKFNNFRREILRIIN